MSLYSDTLFRLRANLFLFLLLNAACLENFNVFWLTRPGLEPGTIYCTRCEHANPYTTDASKQTLTPPMRARQPLHHRCEHANPYTTDASKQTLTPPMRARQPLHHRCDYTCILKCIYNDYIVVA